jgi:hypothetical protein
MHCDTGNIRCWKAGDPEMKKGDVDRQKNIKKHQKGQVLQSHLNLGRLTHRQIAVAPRHESGRADDRPFASLATARDELARSFWVSRPLADDGARPHAPATGHFLSCLH